jgi:hypothetical protein
MQLSLLTEPMGRNIKPVDFADSGDIAKIVETAALPLWMQCKMAA